jgi:fucose permease
MGHVGTGVVVGSGQMSPRQRVEVLMALLLTGGAIVPFVHGFFTHELGVLLPLLEV